MKKGYKKTREMGFLFSINGYLIFRCLNSIINRTHVRYMRGDVIMSRTISHVDLNNFYTSVECLYRPEIRDKAVIVCGDIEARHGIVLAYRAPINAI